MMSAASVFGSQLQRGFCSANSGRRAELAAGGGLSWGQRLLVPLPGGFWGAHTPIHRENQQLQSSGTLIPPKIWVPALGDDVSL